MPAAAFRPVARPALPRSTPPGPPVGTWQAGATAALWALVAGLAAVALPVLVGDRIAAAIDLKADRAAGALLVQQWSWIDGPGEGDKARIEAALGRFERFQFGD